MSNFEPKKMALYKTHILSGITFDNWTEHFASMVILSSYNNCLISF